MKMKRALGAISATALAALWSVPAAAAWTLNLREGVTELSREIYGLHMLILWICVVIAVAVFSVMIYSIATFRTQHQGRNHLDRDPGHDPGRDGDSSCTHAGED
jgi:heme/copper-type cytochrome/quinol oxidase subunit 2